MLEKLSHQDINDLLIKTASIMRSQNEEIKRLRGELAAKSRREHAEKIAHIAVEKGVIDESDASSYAEKLDRGGKDLETVEEFVAQTVAGLPLGESLQKLAEEQVDGHVDGTSPEDKFCNFLLTSDHA
jgi:hypothetical protein